MKIWSTISATHRKTGGTNPQWEVSTPSTHRRTNSDTIIVPMAEEKKNGRPVNKTTTVEDTSMVIAVTGIQEGATRGRDRPRKIAGETTA